MASDTSLVFNLLGRDSISKVLGVIKGAFRSTAATAEESMNDADHAVKKLDKSIEELERDLKKLAIEFALTGDKDLFKKMKDDRTALANLKRIRSEIKGAGDDSDQSGNKVGRLSQFFSDAGGRIGGIVGQLQGFGSVLGGMAGPIQMLAIVTASLIGALYALGPAAALAGGALGSLAGILTGGIAAFGTLKLGLTGLSSEYDRLTKATGGGGGGAAKAAKDFTSANRSVESALRGVAQAEKAVKQAQADALAAQQAINEARETAAQRMRDQAIDLAGAKIDQRQATDDLAQADLDLKNAQRSGNAAEIEKAQLAYDRAKLAVEQAKNKVDDLTKANAENAKKGVEGSDEVVQAKKREQEARQHVADSIEQEREAEERLADARKALADLKAQKDPGGGGGAGQQITKLAPAARKFLDTILALRPAFTNLRLDVQQKLFAGLAGPFRTLAEKWLPRLHQTLGNFAGTFNGIVRTIFATAGSSGFMNNMQTGAEGFRKALGEVGHTVAGPVLDAFGRLSAASAPFVQKLGHLLSEGLKTLSGWIKKADESGKLKAFFQGAADTLGKVMSVGGKVFAIVGKIIKILFPQSKAAGDGFLDGANNALQSISDWLDKPENQKKITDLAGKIFDWGKAIGDFMGKLGFLKSIIGPLFQWMNALADGQTGMWKGLGQVIGGVVWLFKWLWTNVPKAWNALVSGLKTAYNWTVDKLSSLVNWVGSLPGKIGHVTRNMWDGIKNSFRAALNWVIGKWNGIRFSLPTVSFFGQTIGGGSFGVPQIPYLARGGTIDRAGMAVVGERGPELVHLSRGAQVTPLQPSGSRGGRIVLDLRGADNEMKRLIRRWIRVDNLLQTDG